MKGRDAKEIIGIVGRIGPVLLSTVKSSPRLRAAVGALVANNRVILSRAWFTQAFLFCVTLARTEGATLQTMGRVRIAALRETPQSLPAVQIVQAIIRLSLAQEGRLAAASAFASREDVASIADAMNAAFSQAAEVASDDLDAGSYQAIITLQAAVMRHLNDIGRKLPRVVRYSYAVSVPSLVVSQREYGTADRAAELQAENKAIHPAFMPREGKMLAV